MSKFYYFQELPSTNDYALQLGEKGAESGSVVIANSQSQGKGRRERSWFSPEGGLYFSYLLRADITPEKLAGASLVAVNSLVTALNLGCKIQIPNDLFLNGKKLGGILLESRLKGDKLDFLVIGIGLNLNQENFPPELKEIATSVFLETEKKLTPSQLLPALLDQLEKDFTRFFSEGFSVFLPIINKNCLTLGKKVKIKLPEGEISGIAVDINERGNLMIELEGGVREITAFESLRII